MLVIKCYGVVIKNFEEKNVLLRENLGGPPNFCRKKMQNLILGVGGWAAGSVCKNIASVP